MRHKELKIGSEFFIALFSDIPNKGPFEVENGLPSDAEIVGAQYNPLLDVIQIIIRSNEFEELETGDLIPDCNIRIKLRDGKLA